MTKPSKILILFSLLSSFTVLVRSDILVQELFSGMGTGDLNGKGDGTTSLGMTGTWLSNGGANASMTVANNFDVKQDLPGLSAGSSDGGIYRNLSVGNNWNTSIYSTRAMSTSIDFGTDQVIYFSANLRNHGDTAMGIGLAAGANGSAEFVGAGFSWNTFTGGSGNAAYISQGTLDGGQGVYGQAAAEPANSVDGRGLVVGRLTLSSTGNDLIDIIRYAENSTIDADLNAITWSAQHQFDSSMSATHILLWMNGGNNGELDAIRVGESWADVTGVTAIPEPGTLTLVGIFGILTGCQYRKRKTQS